MDNVPFCKKGLSAFLGLVPKRYPNPASMLMAFYSISTGRSMFSEFGHLVRYCEARRLVRLGGELKML